MIDIIIPAYNAHKTIEKTLFSIAYQNLSENCNVYIINDASDKDYGEIIKFFKKFINIKELKLEKNMGPGYARQYGIDNSNSEYIIFIDADDVLSSPFSIDQLYSNINNSNYDVVISKTVEEVDFGFILKDFNTIWLHGKIYRRKFLEKNNICFNDSRQNEDNGFNQLIVLCGAKIKYIDIKTYIWRNNKKSITRKENYKYRLDGLNGYIYNMKWAINEALNRKIDDKNNQIGQLAFMSLMYIYIMYLEFNKEKEFNELIKETTELKKIYLKHSISKELEYTIIEHQINNNYNNCNKEFFLNPICTFNQFLSLLDSGDL